MPPPLKKYIYIKYIKEKKHNKWCALGREKERSGWREQHAREYDLKEKPPSHAALPLTLHLPATDQTEKASQV